MLEGELFEEYNRRMLYKKEAIEVWSLERPVLEGDLSGDAAAGNYRSWWL